MSIAPKRPVVAAVPAAPVAPALKRVGRFTIVRELASGSAGTVYLAHDPIIDRNVAIKTLSNRLTAVERKQYEQHFINEARASGRLSHPHIVTIYEASSENNTTYIAMEYLQGHELSRMLERKHVFSIDDIAGIIRKIADALAYAHKHGVIHRDIKPANIFMVADHHPKLLDFGIARAPNRVSDQPVHQDQPFTLFHNNLLGTPNYMSPEQAMGRTVDASTDIYSLGAVMYEMLTGRKPFQSSSTDKLLHSIAYKAAPSPRDVNPDVPEALAQIVMKAMSKKPEKRYQQADEMSHDIKLYLSKERRERHRLQKAISALPNTILHSKAVRKGRKMPWVVASATAIVLISACAFWLH